MSRKPRVFRTVSQGTARAFVVLAALSLLLSAASGFIAVRAVQGELSSRASVVQLCQAGNDSRAQQLGLWTHIIAISAPPPHQDAAQKAQRAAVIRQFLAYVRKAFGPRDCNHLAGRGTR